MSNAHVKNITITSIEREHEAQKDIENAPKGILITYEIEIIKY